MESDGKMVFGNPAMNKVFLQRCHQRLAGAMNKKFEYHHLAMSRSRMFLRRHDSKKLELFILFVDLGSSTKMSSNMQTETLAKIIRIYSQEMAYVIEYYGGYVLKYVGDAVIGYFTAANTAQNAVDCTHLMMTVIRDAINPYFKKHGLPDLTIKSTIDFGEVAVVRYGHDKTKSHIDIIGLAVNLAAKMQTVGKPRRLIIGKKVYQRLPTASRARFKRLKANSKSWPYHKLGSNLTYPLYWKTM